MKPANKLVEFPAPAPPLTAETAKQDLRDLAVYAMRETGALDPGEIPSEEDLTTAVQVIRDEWTLEHMVEVLERFYYGDPPDDVEPQRRLVLIPGGRGRH
jgi:hypothetical protein